MYAKPLSSRDRSDDQTAVETLASELDALQHLLYADKRFKLRVVLQGTDTYGKNGTLCGVFSRMSPLGVQTVPYYDSRRIIYGVCQDRGL